MAINFNTNPYYDDFDETKQFHRILFRPGYAVQARELTQLQSQLNDQIRKFGEHIFVNGSVVLNGGRTFEDNLKSIKLDPSFAGQSVNVSEFLNKTIIGSQSGTKAIVKAVANLTSTDPITLVVNISSGDTFTPGEQIDTSDSNASALVQQTSPINDAMLFSIDSGIYFIDGNFVYTEPQTVVVDKYSNTSSKKIGFTVTESIIDSDTDESLLDRAQGSPNYAAPGADRFKVSLTLTTLDINATNTEFIEIARVEDGLLVVNKSKTVYSEIGKELSRRTFDESGDYTVKKWPIQVLDHQDQTPDATKFSIGLGPGKGYIKGYEYETISEQFVTLDRARDFEVTSNLDVSTLFGNYLYVNNVNGNFDTSTSNATDAFEPVLLRNSSNANIGTARVRYIQWDGGNNNPASSAAVKYKLYLFDIAMTGSNVFGSVDNIINVAGTATADVDSDSKVGGNGATFLSGTDTPGLVFKFPNEYIRTLKDQNGLVDASYRIQRKFTLPFSGGTVSISSSDQYERFITNNIGNDMSDLYKNEYYHVVDASGNIINFDSSNGRSITVQAAQNGQTQQVDFDFNNPSFGDTCTLIATVDVNDQVEKTKSLSTYQYLVISSPNTVVGGLDTLGVADIYDVKAIYNTSNTNPTTQVSGNFDITTGNITNWDQVPNSLVTDDYIVDNGQRSEFYDHGGIKLSGSAPAATDYLVVVYRNFTHTGNGYFSVDSYSGLNYEDIPTFQDPASGQSINLRDAIDFRPRRDDNSTNLSGGLLPSPDSRFEISYSYYLARMDKIIATSDQEFIVKKGVSALYPKVPSDVTNGMTIYIVVIPPYTANVRDVAIKYMDNKRYTMRDIGKLEKRINNLEYYTQLSLLEKQAKDTSIPDSSNFEKFKNGFAVDAFTSADIFASAANDLWAQRRWGWWNSWFNGSNNWNNAAQNYNENSIANAANSDFAAAIDPVNQELRSTFSTEFYYFNTGTLTNTKRSGDNISLDYGQVSAMEQLLATTYVNVNPFNVIRFLGKITLEPSFDQWVDTNVLPSVNRIVDVRIPETSETIQRFVGSGNAARLVNRTVTVEDTIIGQTTQSLGTNVVDIQFVPFIRGSSTIGVGKLFKPNSRLYGFMENTSIDQYLKPLTLLVVKNHQNALFDDSVGVYESLSIRTGNQTGAEVGTAKTALYSSVTTTSAPGTPERLLAIYDESGTIQAGDFVFGLTGQGYAEIVSVTTYSLGDALVPNEFGELAFEFEIPAGTFRTGERTIRLINNNTNDAEAQDSLGEAIYTAIGQLQTKQETILTTRSIQKQTTILETFRRYRVDPVAQTFTVGAEQYPNGMHLTEVDVYFRNKSSTVPVTMEIRRTVNGYPESQTTSIPGAIVTLKPEDVNADTTGATPTTFKFPAIHLTPDDYAITILANSSDYEVFIAEMGETILGGGGKVDKQPNMGSLFKSQNAATWEPNQNQDLKFVIRRAQFSTSGSIEFNIQDPQAIKNYHVLFANVNAITPTGSDVQWSAKAYNGVHDTDWAPIDINQDIEYTRLLQLDTAANAGSIPTLRLKADLTTTTDHISPVVDASSLSVVVTENIINDPANDPTTYPNGLQETSPRGGNALARYITKPITLADGFDASNLNVTVDVNRPSGTNVAIFYRALPSGSLTPITDESWIQMSLEKAVESSINSFDYKEHRYFPPGAFGNFGIPNDDPISPRFNTFQIKIVMLSTQVQNTPKLKDLRIIALDD